MYIYNVTINIETEIQEAWLTWMQEIHIPAMLNTGKFTAAKLCQVMVEEDMGGITYAIQYAAPNKAALDSYYKEDAELLRKDGVALFGNKFVAFRTELTVISEH